MTNYNPDNWKILKIVSKKLGKESHFVVAGFAGGYTYGRSWKISSGITGVGEKTDDYVDFNNTSGSVYRCYFGREGLDYFTSGIIESYRKIHEDNGDGFDLIDYKDYQCYHFNPAIRPDVTSSPHKLFF